MKKRSQVDVGQRSSEEKEAGLKEWAHTPMVPAEDRGEHRVGTGRAVTSTQPWQPTALATL